ncbi:hypothetical protein KEM55_006098, partial [Ascosphaera atra]
IAATMPSQKNQSRGRTLAPKPSYNDLLCELRQYKDTAKKCTMSRQLDDDDEEEEGHFMHGAAPLPEDDVFVTNSPDPLEQGAGLEHDDNDIMIVSDEPEQHPQQKCDRRQATHCDEEHESEHEHEHESQPQQQQQQQQSKNKKSNSSHKKSKATSMSVTPRAQRDASIE